MSDLLCLTFKLPCRLYVRHESGYICKMELEFSLDQIRQAAQSFWNFTGENIVVALHGPMGAGKTTFIHALCDNKKVMDTVGSPTFSIINEYHYAGENRVNVTEKIIYHMDLYRIRSEEEARQAGVEDCLYSGHTCLVEWPEKAISLFPPATIHVYLDIINTTTRRLRISDN